MTTNGVTYMYGSKPPLFFGNGPNLLRSMVCKFMPILRPALTRVISTPWLYNQSFTVGKVTRKRVRYDLESICVTVVKIPEWDWYGTSKPVVELFFELPYQDCASCFDFRLGYRLMDGERADYSDYVRYFLYVGAEFPDDAFIRGFRVYPAVLRVC